jgi:hypothetical protein
MAQAFIVKRREAVNAHSILFAGGTMFMAIVVNVTVAVVPQ